MFTAIVLLGLAPAALPAQAVLSGIIRHDSSGAPLAGVEVLVQGVDRRVVTGRDGRYLLDRLPAGRRTAIMRSIGFLAVHTEVFLADRDTVRLNLRMIPSVAVLPEVEVPGNPMRGVGIGRDAFEERRRMGFGIFLDSTEMRRNEHRKLSDMLRARNGVYVPRSRYGGGVILGRTRCPMFIYLDGQPLGPTESSMFPPSSLESAEIYPSAASVPGEYGGPRAACGVMLLWSRRGP